MPTLLRSYDLRGNPTLQLRVTGLRQREDRGGKGRGGEGKEGGEGSKAEGGSGGKGRGGKGKGGGEAEVGHGKARLDRQQPAVCPLCFAAQSSEMVLMTKRVHVQRCHGWYGWYGWCGWCGWW
eukprot:355152-Chlamydomonas_euryale.AAC.4